MLGSTPAEVYFRREVIKSANEAKKAMREVADLPKALVKKEMHDLNNKLHRSSHPITHGHMKKGIDGGGRVSHAATSRAAKAILKAPETIKAVKRFVDKPVCFRASVLFTANRDLARAFYQATITGTAVTENGKIKLDGLLSDTFDFRWGWLPKQMTIPGTKLRLAGNIAFIAQEMRLLRPVKVDVKLSGYLG